MAINWSLVTVLFIFSLPGVLIAIPRLVNHLLKNNSEEIKKRITLFAVGQTLLMVFIMCLAGTILSKYTHLGAPILEPLINDQSLPVNLLEQLFPVFLYTVGGLMVFFILYYVLTRKFVDEKNFKVMRELRAAFGVDGSMLYAGAVEEILARWGLFNVLAFFGLLLFGEHTEPAFWAAILLSGIFYSISQLPAYLAAGCQYSRSFLYGFFLLNIWQTLLFGFIFWQYGLLMVILAHMFFHLAWWLFDNPTK